MSRRHLKVIAVAALVVVALTGARRGGDGGGCDDNSDSSSSGSVSSGTSGGSDDVFDVDIPDVPTATSGGTTTGGTTNGGTTGGSRPSSRPNATDDVRVTSCDYDETTQKFRTGLKITNSSSDTMRYTITVRTEQTDGSRAGTLLSSDTVRENDIAPGEVREVVSESFRPMHEPATFKCLVSRASKYAVS